MATGLVLWKSRQFLIIMFCWLLWQPIWFFFIYCCQSHCLLRSLLGRQKAPCARVCLDTHDFHKGPEIHKQNKPQQHFHYSRALCVIALIWPDQSYVRGLWAANPAALTYKIFHVSSHAALWFTTPGTTGASEKQHRRCNNCIKKLSNLIWECSLRRSPLLSDWERRLFCVSVLLHDDVVRSCVSLGQLSVQRNTAEDSSVSRCHSLPKQP